MTSALFVYTSNGGGGVIFLLVLLAFFLVPVLLLRSARRAVSMPTGGPGWGGPPQRPATGGWDVPQEPVLPPVAAADVVSLRDRLGHDVRTLEPGTDPVARQAMADAAERLSTCTTLLERASSDAQLRTAWLAAVEGLAASRVVRTRLGLDPGPEIPLPPTGPRLQQDTRFDVGGRPHVGGPDYAPGRPHWFPGGAYGGRYVPSGWYDAPFWPSGLLLGGLAGFAVGGLLAGSMYGDGLYDDGYGPGWGDDAWGDTGYDDGWGGGGDGGYGDGSGGGWGDSSGGGWGDGGYGDSSGGGWGDGGGGGWGDGGGGGWSDGGGWGGGDGGGWGGDSGGGGGGGGD